MFRLLFIILLAFGASGVCLSQMSDSHVIQYLKDGQKAGKTEKQMIQELSARGVTREQAERIKRNYDASQKKNGGASNQSVSSQKTEGRYNAADDLPERSFDLIEQEIAEKELSGSTEKKIFGKSIFKSKELSFEPNFNMATPENYRLGPGDEVVIHVWGANEAAIRQVITPEGDIVVNNIGPVYLSGMTIKEANQYIRREFSKIYMGIDSANDVSQIRLTLGQIRSIQINVMGEVNLPGTYRVSSFASLFHAIYNAGGVNEIGTLRNIMLMRDGRSIANLDIYDLILTGRLDNDIRLMDGDFIIVPPYDAMVNISGKVKRDMYYEIKKGETLASLLKFAGGFSGDAYTKSMRVIRERGTEYQLYTVDDKDFPNFRLEDGDKVSVDSILDRFKNRIYVDGAVYRPGMYELSGAVSTVRQLVHKADGLKGDAFLNRALLYREHEDLSKEMIAINIAQLMEGREPDIPLQRNDSLYISSIHDLQEERYFTISGYVAKPDMYVYTENTTLEDLILQAGGLLEAASTVQVDLSRRIKDPQGYTASGDLSEIFTFAVKDGLVIDGKPNFILKPYDDVVVRRSPSYQEQRKVVIRGEVAFEGEYTLRKKNERLSDLVIRANGITPDAYPQGARLLRKMTEDEKTMREITVQMAARKVGNDSIATNPLFLNDTYSVGIELDKALANPGSDYDIVLREGDELIIPEYQSTVRINGVVMYPNNVTYKKDKKLSYYINQAGGYGHRAKKSKVYIVYMNGTVTRVSRFKQNVVQPGCEIIVPSKRERKGGDTLTTIMSLATTSASIATMAATIANLTK